MKLFVTFTVIVIFLVADHVAPKPEGNLICFSVICSWFIHLSLVLTFVFRCLYSVKDLIFIFQGVHSGSCSVISISLILDALACKSRRYTKYLERMD